MASSAGCTRGEVRTNPATSPAAVPMKVSTIRPLAADLVPTDMMSIALMGTSRTSSCRCIAYPTVSPSAMAIPRLHQVNPTHADSPSASRTPATTLATLRTAVRSVW